MVPDETGGGLRCKRNPPTSTCDRCRSTSFALINPAYGLLRVLWERAQRPRSAIRGSTSFENIVRLSTVSSWLIGPPCPIINRWPKLPTWS